MQVYAQLTQETIPDFGIDESGLCAISHPHGYAG